MVQSDLSGNRLGKYILQRVLGRGGMGEVYEALDPETGRTVAIKVLPTSLSAQPGYLERFNQELKLAASLEHIHILPIYDHGSENGTTYIVMRYLTGSDLANRLHKLGRPSTADARKLLRQVGLALDYAHQRGIVHRDLKPNNIMFDDQGNAYLGDFGIAKVIGTGSGLTGTGQIVGTPYYMAPEQVKADEVDARADIYSLGIIAFQLLTGELPFIAPTPYAVMYKHISDPPPLLTELQGNLDPRVDEIIHRALAKEPNDRYQSAYEFVQDLDAILTNIPDSEQGTGFMTVQVDTTDSELTYTPPRTPRTTRGQQRARRPSPILVAVVLGVIVTVAFAAVMLTGGDDETDPTPTESGNVAATISDTPEPTPTNTLSAEEITAASATAIEETIQSSMNQALDLQASVTAERMTQTAAAWTDTPTIDPIATGNARLTATYEEQIAQDQTLTATLWTPTPTDIPASPTPDVSATFVAFNTARANWTDTPTVNAAATFQAINTARANWTNTPTLDVQGTFDAANTARAGWTDTPTVDVSATFDAINTARAENASTEVAEAVPDDPFELARIGVESNDDWEPVVQEFDGVEMVLVPAGCLMVMCNEEPYWIDRFEVSARQFERLRGVRSQASFFRGADNPVERITWFEAQAFCETRGGRLPIGHEWRFAVAGPDDLSYPWGYTFEENRANHCDQLCVEQYGSQGLTGDSDMNDGYAGTAPVGTYDNSSWVGAYDLPGNVAEWAANSEDDDGGIVDTRAVYGGSFASKSEFLTFNSVAQADSDNGYVDIGFRCVRDFE